MENIDINIDIDKDILENINIVIDIDKHNLENIDIGINIAKDYLENIYIDIDIDMDLLENIDINIDINRDIFSADLRLFSCFFDEKSISIVDISTFFEISMKYRHFFENINIDKISIRKI